MTLRYLIRGQTLDAYRVRVEGDMAGFRCNGAPSLDITSDFLAGLIPPGEPLVPGNDWSLRLKLEDALTGAAINLNPGTAALLLLTIGVDSDSPARITRRSDVVLGAGFQIEMDSQTTDNGTSGTTGRGWFKIRFARTDQDLLEALIGMRPYSLFVHFNAGEAHLALIGVIEIMDGHGYPVP